MSEPLRQLEAICLADPFHGLPLISELDTSGMTLQQVIAEFKALFEAYGYEDVDTSYVVQCFEVIEKVAQGIMHE